MFVYLEFGYSGLKLGPCAIVGAGCDRRFNKCESDATVGDISILAAIAIECGSRLVSTDVGFESAMQSAERVVEGLTVPRR